jgi:hypothetical protein
MMASPRLAPPALDVSTLWRTALDRWSHSIELALPVPIAPPDDSIAYIDLGTRQTHVNYERLRAMGVLEHLPCVLAHEVGHHIRYPHTLTEARRMMRFLRQTAREVFVVEGAAIDSFDWLLNVFFDLLINDELSDELEDSFVTIFRSLRAPGWRPSFSFYLGIFEELWGLEPCAMMDASHDAALSAIEPEWRRRARAAGEFIRAHPENRPLQLARFLVALRPFIGEDDAEHQEGGAFESKPLSGSKPLDGDEIADLMRRRADEEAARRWLREHGEDPTKGGKLAPNASSGASGGNPLANAQQRLEGLAAPDEIAIAVYRREAERAQLEIPGSLEAGEPVLPGPHEQWELGDDFEAIDWLGSVTRAGGPPIPGMTTVTRARLADEPRVGEREAPWVELYIDSSCSMPNPQLAYSHQIEAGFILVNAATRAGGRVRVIQYSSVNQRVVMEGFARAARPAQRKLVEYIGGGTDFPWDELALSTARYRRVARVRRVVLSDGDFLANAESPNPEVDVPSVIAAAVTAGGFTGLLNIGGGAEKLAAYGMEIVSVADWTSVGQAARALADALFRGKEKSKRS